MHTGCIHEPVHEANVGGPPGVWALTTLAHVHCHFADSQMGGLPRQREAGIVAKVKKDSAHG